MTTPTAPQLDDGGPDGVMVISWWAGTGAQPVIRVTTSVGEVQDPPVAVGSGAELHKVLQEWMDRLDGV